MTGLVLRVGLIGAGVAGERHAAAVRACNGAALTAVHDTDPRRAAALASRFGVPEIAGGLSELLDGCDAAVIASPATTHASIAVQALTAGRHVLVERPMATTRAEARAMIEKAAGTGKVLQVGHREGPIIRALGLLDAPVPVRSFDSVREVLPREHVADVSVVLDLMIQDLFVAATLFAAPVVAVRASKLAGKPGVIDAAEARLRFRGGGEARIRASRVSASRAVSWRLAYGDGQVVVDFVRGDIARTTPFPGTTEFPALDGDPVAQGFADFLAQCNGSAPHNPSSSNAGALNALDLAVHIQTILDDCM